MAFGTDTACYSRRRTNYMAPTIYNDGDGGKLGKEIHDHRIAVGHVGPKTVIDHQNIGRDWGWRRRQYQR